MLSKYTTAQYITFFDLIEDSYFDLLLVSKDKAGHARIHAIYNNIDRTPFFLKVHTISESTLGSAVPSASYRCVVSSVSDGKFIAVAGSAGQTAYQSLQLPFSHVGIGRSNNFIEQFTVATYSDGKRSLKQWSPIIPKSILFIDVKMSYDSQLWQLDLLAKPMQKLPLVILVDGLFLMCLSLVIIVLHLQEKSED